MVCRAIGISALVAILFVAGCTTANNAPTVSITGAATQVDPGKTDALTASVSNDKNSAGVTWAITSGSGTLTGPTTTGVTYNAPATVASVTTVVVTATSVTDMTKTSTFTITLEPTPQVTTTTMSAGIVGTAYNSTVSMTGGVAPYSWSLIAGPAGLSLAASTTNSVAVQGTPTAAGPNQTFTIKVTDAQGLSVTSSGLTITIYPTLVITPPSLPVGVGGVSYTSPAFTASGGSGSGYTFAVASGSLAPLTIGSSNGIISGTPTTSGTLQFTVKVTDSASNTVSTSSLSITINPAITIGLGPASPVTLDQGKTQLVTATVSNDPSSAGVTWSAVTGLGSLTGSTATTITYNAPASVASASTATFKATSVTDPTKSATYSVNLVPPPQITTTTMAAGNVNGAYSSVVNMSGGVAPYTWAIVAAPVGLTLSSSTTNSVTVQGTPTVSGNNQTFTIKVTDAQGLSVTSSGLTITIYPTLVITPPSLPVGVVGVSYTSPAFTASGGSGSGYTFAVASGSLAPLTIGSSNGIISGTPTTSGTLQFTVKVTDSASNTVSTSSLSITINPAITVGLGPASPVTLDQGKTQLVTATVSNDPSSAGVTWSAVTGLGSLTGSTSTTITYNAPASVASASTATFKATSVTDPTKSATYTVNLVPPPQITTTTMAAGNVNGTYSSVVNMSGGVAPYTWAIVAAPVGLTLSSSTTSSVTVQGTPTVSGNGQTFTIKVTDAQGLSVTSSGLTIDIYSQLVLTPPSTPLPTGVQGLNYPTTVTFAASGGSGTGYTWSVVAASPLPTGLALSSASGASTSITAGPPTAAGTYPFSVKLTDSVGNTATTSGLSITINPPISVGFSPVSPITMDQGTAQVVTATVSNDPSSAGVTWSALTGLGSLSGSTSTAITYNAPATVGSSSSATFTATSVTDPTKSATFTVNLVPPPQIAAPTFPDATLNASYTPYAVTVNGGVGPYTWVGTTLPLGMQLSSSTTNTVNLQGTPQTAGTNQTVTIKVTDAKGLTNTVTSTINVVAPSCSSNCTISGTVTGPWVSGITLSRSGSSTTTTTDANGHYSFTGLAGGTYTITPSLAGYTFSPSAPQVATSASTTTQDFTEASAVSSYSISGTITYAGVKTGVTLIRVYQTSCSDCNAVAGTSISTKPSSSGTAYTVRGLQPTGNGNPGYIVSAEIDTLGTGEPNMSNPGGSSNTITVSANVTGVNFTVADRTPAPVAPSGLNIAPQSTAAVAQVKVPKDSNTGEEIATSYRVYYAIGNNFTGASFQTFPAHGTHDNVFILSGLTNGSNYYFEMTALVGATESAPSNVVGPVTLGPAAGGAGTGTVSGTVTFPGSATGPMYVGVYSNSGSGIYAVRIANPVTGVSYSVPGVPNGSYSNFAIIDNNNNGIIDLGDITNASGNSNPPAITVNGNTTGNITLTALATALNVATSHQQFSPSIGNPDVYNLSLTVTWGSKRPVAITLFSGPNVPVPFDISPDTNGSVQTAPFLNSAVPQVGDTYQYEVTYSDTTTAILSSSVTVVPNWFARNLAMNSPVNSTSGTPLTVPMLNWSAPSAPPSSYTYNIGLYDTGNSGEFWYYSGGNNSNGIPSSQTNVQFDTDGSASPNSSLTSGSTYYWWVTVQDDKGNSTQYTTKYVP